MSPVPVVLAQSILLLVLGDRRTRLGSEHRDCVPLGKTSLLSCPRSTDSHLDGPRGFRVGIPDCGVCVCVLGSSLGSCALGSSWDSRACDNNSTRLWCLLNYRLSAVVPVAAKFTKVLVFVVTFLYLVAELLLLITGSLQCSSPSLWLRVLHLCPTEKRANVRSNNVW
jgi:hypothetical protein